MIHKARLFFRQSIRQTQKESSVLLDGHSLTMDQLSQLSTGDTKVEIAQESWDIIHAARKIVKKVLTAEKRESYFGINTGVGIFSNVKINDEDMEEY